MKLTKKIIAEIENKTCCSVNDEGDYYDIIVDNSCDEDFRIEVKKGKDTIQQIIDYCDGFDAGEHFKMWYGVGRGEPSDPEVLLNNCKEIAENLEQLSDLLRKYN